MRLVASTLLLLVTLFTISGCATQRRSVLHVDPPALRPNDWFNNQRQTADPIPPNAVANALADAASRGVPLVDGPGTWESLGPRNVGGRLTSLAVDPNDVLHVWAGTAAGGVWETTDGGTNWTPRFDAQTSLSIGAVAAHPTNSNIVYVGTGEDNGGGYSFDGDGVYKTTDRGLTWQSVGLTAARRIGKIAVDPGNGDRLFVAAGGNWFGRSNDRGVYRSTDGGINWQQVLFVADDVGAIDVAIDPSNTNRIYAAMWQRLSSGSSWYVGGSLGGIYRSEDGGTSWTKLTSVLPATPGRIGLAIAPSSPQTVYALIINSTGSGLNGIFRSTNSGTTWTKRSNASAEILFVPYSYYFGKIRVDPTNANTIYCLDAQLLRSTNGGTNLVPIAGAVHSDFHDLRIQSSGRWYIADDGGFYRSLDGGNTWFHSERLLVSQVYDIGIDNLDTRRRFVGLQDNNVQRTTTGGQDYEAVIGGDGLQAEVDPTNSNKVYGESQYGAIQRSTDGGATFLAATTGIDSADRTNWNTPITLDPIVPQTLYTGTYRVYRSTDSAQSWTAISGNLSNTAPGGFAEGLRPVDGWKEAHWGTNHLENLISGTVTVVQVSPVNRSVLWAGTDDGNVWVSDDLGSNWRKVNPPGTAYWVTDIAPDPRSSQTAYLTVTGFRSNSKLPYLRVTRDLGVTWSDISGGLPQLPLNTVLSDTDWRGRLFVGSDIGVHWSDDEGASWQLLGGGLPRSVMFDLWKHESSNTLWIGAFSRGLYRYDLGQLPAIADGDGDGVDNNIDCALGDAGAFATPIEVTPLVVGKVGASAELSWPSQVGNAGSGVTYDVVRGDATSLVTVGLAGASAYSCGQAATSVVDAEALTAGSGMYYVVRARNRCGAATWGRNSSGAERLLSVCP